LWVQSDSALFELMEWRIVSAVNTDKLLFKALELAL
jgi:hypothetical protein